MHDLVGVLRTQIGKVSKVIPEMRCALIFSIEIIRSGQRRPKNAPPNETGTYIWVSIIPLSRLIKYDLHHLMCDFVFAVKFNSERLDFNRFSFDC